MIGLLFVAAFAAFAILMEIVTMRRCRRRIEQWAEQNQYQLQSANRRWLSTGPWGFWTSGRSSRFFVVTVMNPPDGKRVAWARLRGGWGGYAADEIEVRWSS